MRHTLLIVILFLCVCSAHAEQIKLFMTGSKDLEQYYVLESDHALRLPRWTPADAQGPPLELDRAFGIVNTQIQKHLSAEEWKYLSIMLKPGATSASRAIWSYRFAILHRPKKAKSSYTLWTLVVLMDGSLMAPDPKDS